LITKTKMKSIINSSKTPKILRVFDFSQKTNASEFVYVLIFSFNLSLENENPTYKI